MNSQFANRVLLAISASIFLILLLLRFTDITDAVIAVIGSAIGLITLLFPSTIKFQESSWFSKPIMTLFLTMLCFAGIFYIFNTSSNSIDVPLDSTVTNSSTSVANIPTNIPIKSTTTTELTPTTPFTVSDPFIWNGQPLSRNQFYAKGSVSMDFTNEGLKITGRYSGDRVWINNTLPENFSAKITFTPTDDECYLYTGFGDGANVEPSYFARLSGRTSLGRNSISRESDDTLATEEVDLINANQKQVITLERLNKVIILTNDQNSLILRREGAGDTEWTNINSLNTLWIYVGFPGRHCTIFINSIDVREIN